MLSGFPSLHLAKPPARIDEDYEMTKATGCVRNSDLLHVKSVRLSIAALLSIAAHAPSATSRYSPGGKLLGLQMNDTLEVTWAHRNAQSHRGASDESEEERRIREREERAKDEEMLKELYGSYRAEEFDTLHVGNYVISSACVESGYTQRALGELMKLVDINHPSVLIVYDPFRTGLLGKPYVKAFVPTTEYVDFNRKYAAKRNTNIIENSIVRECKVAKAGVLRELPVYLDVDEYQMLALQSYHVESLPPSVEVMSSPVVEEYTEALLEAVKTNVEDLTRALAKENSVNQKENKESPLCQRIDTLLKLMQLKDQAAHLEALCDGVLLNTAFVRDVVQ